MAAGSSRQPNDYAELKRLIVDAGLLRSQHGYYIGKVAVTVVLATMAVVFVFLAHSWPMVVGSAIFLGFASTQAALLAHDVGHRQAFRGRRLNMVARLVIGNLALAVSHSWWNAKHNQHHATPNHVDKDPDIQFPMLAFSAEQVASRPRIFRPLLQVQAFLLAALMPFQVINMRINSAQSVVRGGLKRTWPEAVMLAGHFALYAALVAILDSWVMALVFVVVHHAVFGLYNSTVFASNHKGMPLIQEGNRLDFFREQVLTSRNIHGHWATDFWYGGLNYQIEHHLFPTMPRNNLSKAQRIVRQFCAAKGVPYHSAGVVETYREVFGHLHNVGRAVSIGDAASESG